MNKQHIRTSGFGGRKLGWFSATKAFCLVEVTMAIGIISFGLVGIFGLLLVGLMSVQTSNEQAAAARVVDALIQAIRNPVVDTDGKAVVLFDGEKYPLSTSEVLWQNLTLEGNEDEQARCLSARLHVLTMPTSTSAGRAIVSVAWSARSNPSWNPEDAQWENAQGFLTSGVRFLDPLQ